MFISVVATVLMCLSSTFRAPLLTPFFKLFNSFRSFNFDLFGTYTVLAGLQMYVLAPRHQAPHHAPSSSTSTGSRHFQRFQSRRTRPHDRTFSPSGRSHISIICRQQYPLAQPRFIKGKDKGSAKGKHKDKGIYKDIGKVHEGNKGKR
jgi:hypothetical protein